MQNTKILDIARTDNNVWNEHHVHIYRTFSSHGDSPHPVYTSESHLICALWNVSAATVILFARQFASLEVAHRLSGLVLQTRTFDEHRYLDVLVPQLKIHGWQILSTMMSYHRNVHLWCTEEAHSVKLSLQWRSLGSHRGDLEEVGWSCSCLCTVDGSVVARETT